MSSKLVFVTGASGYFGSHVVIQLLQKGYKVRAAVRPHKVDEIRSTYTKLGFKDRFEPVAVADIAVDQFPDALKGVSAILHIASPLPAKASPDKILEGAIEGTLNVILQGDAAGVKRYVVTSSIVSVGIPGGSTKHFTDQDWNSVSKEEALKATGMDAYIASKTLAERELWAYVDSHPDLDVTTFNPPWFFGPLADSFKASKPDISALSTSGFIYALLSPQGSFPSSAPYIDVRDLAKAHVIALDSPASSQVGRKRLIIASPYDLDFKEIIGMLKKERPDLKDRITQVESPSHAVKKLPYDEARVESVLGLTKEDYTSAEKTILDTVDSLLKLEKEWIANGYAVGA